MADNTNAKVIGNAQSINGELEQLGTTYNPSEASIMLGALQDQTAAADAAEEAAINEFDLFDPFRKTRKELFDPIDDNCLGAKGIFNGSGTTPAQQKSFMAKYRKLCGIRKVAKLKNPPPDSPKYISVSQQEFDSKLVNYLAIIVMLENNVKYNPNEDEFKTVTMRNNYNAAKASNAAAKLASGPYHAALELRDRLLYRDVTGLCDTYNHAVKEYCKGPVRKNNPAVFKRIMATRLKKRPYFDPSV